MDRHNTEFRLYCVEHTDPMPFIKMWLTINIHQLIKSHTVTVGMNRLALFTTAYVPDAVVQVLHVRTIIPLLAQGHMEVFMKLPRNASSYAIFHKLMRSNDFTFYSTASSWKLIVLSCFRRTEF